MPLAPHAIAAVILFHLPLLPLRLLPPIWLDIYAAAILERRYFTPRHFADAFADYHFTTPPRIVTLLMMLRCHDIRHFAICFDFAAITPRLRDDAAAAFSPCAHTIRCYVDIIIFMPAADVISDGFTLLMPLYYFFTLRFLALAYDAAMPPFAPRFLHLPLSSHFSLRRHTPLRRLFAVDPVYYHYLYASDAMRQLLCRHAIVAAI